MRAIMGCVLGVLLVASVGLADDKIDGKKLVGKWQPAEKKDNVTIEFGKDNKLTIQVEIGGKSEKMEGTYKLDGNKLSVKLKFMDQDQTDEVTVNKLTDEELETTDKNGKKESLKKVK